MSSSEDHGSSASESAREPAAHTPGPWRAMEDAIFAGGDCLATCDAGNDDEVEDGANARLMAAAPDLLEQAKLLERFLVYEIAKDDRKGDDEGANLKGFTLHVVRQAIAKATGSAQ